jgi:hypothetical protein
MKRLMSGIAVGALTLASVATLGVTAAGAAASTSSVVLTGKAPALYGPASSITATTNAPGAVSFTANGTAIAGCTTVATTAATPFVAICPYTATAAGTFAVAATFTPTDTTNFTSASSNTLSLVTALPVQGQTPSPITFYVDTVIGGGATGAAVPGYPWGTCSISNEFLVGQTIVFRIYGNDADLGGAVLTPKNVSSATVTVSGVATPIPLNYGAHGALAFYTGVLQTGNAAGQYNTLGIVNYKVTFNTIAVPAVTKKIAATKFVPVLHRGQHVVVNHRVVYHMVRYQKTVIVTPAVAGATGLWQSNFTPSSVLTLNATH